MATAARAQLQRLFDVALALCRDGGRRWRAAAQLKMVEAARLQQLLGDVWRMRDVGVRVEGQCADGAALVSSQRSPVAELNAAALQGVTASLERLRYRATQQQLSGEFLCQVALVVLRELLALPLDAPVRLPLNAHIVGRLLAASLDAGDASEPLRELFRRTFALLRQHAGESLVSVGRADADDFSLDAVREHVLETLRSSGAPPSSAGPAAAPRRPRQRDGDAGDSSSGSDVEGSGEGTADGAAAERGSSVSAAASGDVRAPAAAAQPAVALDDMETLAAVFLRGDERPSTMEPWHFAALVPCCTLAGLEVLVAQIAWDSWQLDQRTAVEHVLAPLQRRLAALAAAPDSAAAFPGALLRIVPFLMGLCSSPALTIAVLLSFVRCPWPARFVVCFYQDYVEVDGFSLAQRQLLFRELLSLAELPAGAGTAPLPSLHTQHVHVLAALLDRFVSANVPVDTRIVEVCGSDRLALLRLLVRLVMAEGMADEHALLCRVLVALSAARPFACALRAELRQEVQALLRVLMTLSNHCLLLVLSDLMFAQEAVENADGAVQFVLGFAGSELALDYRVVQCLVMGVYGRVLAPRLEAAALLQQCAAIAEQALRVSALSVRVVTGLLPRIDAATSPPELCACMLLLASGFLASVPLDYVPALVRLVERTCSSRDVAQLALQVCRHEATQASPALRFCQALLQFADDESAGSFRAAGLLAVCREQHSLRQAHVVLVAFLTCASVPFSVESAKAVGYLWPLVLSAFKPGVLVGAALHVGNERLLWNWLASLCCSRDVPQALAESCLAALLYALRGEAWVRAVRALASSARAVVAGLKTDVRQSLWINEFVLDCVEVCCAASGDYEPLVAQLVPLLVHQAPSVHCLFAWKRVWRLHAANSTVFGAAARRSLVDYCQLAVRRLAGASEPFASELASIFDMFSSFCVELLPHEGDVLGANPTLQAQFDDAFRDLAAAAHAPLPRVPLLVHEPALLERPLRDRREAARVLMDMAGEARASARSAAPDLELPAAVAARPPQSDDANELARASLRLSAELASVELFDREYVALLAKKYTNEPWNLRVLLRCDRSRCAGPANVPCSTQRCAGPSAAWTADTEQNRSACASAFGEARALSGALGARCAATLLSWALYGTRGELGPVLASVFVAAAASRVVLQGFESLVASVLESERDGAGSAATASEKRAFFACLMRLASSVPEAAPGQAAAASGSLFASTLRRYALESGDFASFGVLEVLEWIGELCDSRLPDAVVGALLERVDSEGLWRALQASGAAFSTYAPSLRKLLLRKALAPVTVAVVSRFCAAGGAESLSPVISMLATAAAHRSLPRGWSYLFAKLQFQFADESQADHVLALLADSASLLADCSETSNLLVVVLAKMTSVTASGWRCLLGIWRSFATAQQQAAPSQSRDWALRLFDACCALAERSGALAALWAIVSDVLAVHYAGERALLGAAMERFPWQQLLPRGAQAADATRRIVSDTVALLARPDTAALALVIIERLPLHRVIAIPECLSDVVQLCLAARLLRGAFPPSVESLLPVKASRVLDSDVEEMWRQLNAVPLLDAISAKHFVCLLLQAGKSAAPRFGESVCDCLTLLTALCLLRVDPTFAVVVAEVARSFVLTRFHWRHGSWVLDEELQMRVVAECLIPLTRRFVNTPAASAPLMALLLGCVNIEREQRCDVGGGGGSGGDSGAAGVTDVMFVSPAVHVEALHAKMVGVIGQWASTERPVVCLEIVGQVADVVQSQDAACDIMEDALHTLLATSESSSNVMLQRAVASLHVPSPERFMQSCFDRHAALCLFVFLSQRKLAARNAPEWRSIYTWILDAVRRFRAPEQRPFDATLLYYLVIEVLSDRRWADGGSAAEVVVVPDFPVDYLRHTREFPRMVLASQALLLLAQRVFVETTSGTSGRLTREYLDRVDALLELSRGEQFSGEGMAQFFQHAEALTSPRLVKMDFLRDVVDALFPMAPYLAALFGGSDDDAH